MSEEPEVVVLDEEDPQPEPPKPTEKPKAKPEPEKTLGKEFFDHFGGKAPHYRIHPYFSIDDISAEDADKCRLFTTWAKPKRHRLTVEWAEEMFKLKKLARLEHPFSIEY